MSSPALYTHLNAPQYVLTIYSTQMFLNRGDFLHLHNANLSERVCVCVCYSPAGPGPLVLGETPVSGGWFLL